MAVSRASPAVAREDRFHDLSEEAIDRKIDRGELKLFL